MRFLLLCDDKADVVVKIMKSPVMDNSVYFSEIEFTLKMEAVTKKNIDMIYLSHWFPSLSIYLFSERGSFVFFLLYFLGSSLSKSQKFLCWFFKAGSDLCNTICLLCLGFFIFLLSFNFVWFLMQNLVWMHVFRQLFFCLLTTMQKCIKTFQKLLK